MKRQKENDGMYRLTVTAPDNRQLQWLMRTELGDGPLSLLKLRNFTLPSKIFSVDAAILSGNEPSDGEYDDDDISSGAVGAD
jgi:type VI secretion system protein ImpL